MAIEGTGLVVVLIVAVVVLLGWGFSRSHGSYNSHFNTAPLSARTRELEEENRIAEQQHHDEVPAPVDPTGNDIAIREQEERLAEQEREHQERQRLLDEQRRRLEEQMQRLEEARRQAEERLNSIMQQLQEREAQLVAAGHRQRAVEEDIARLEREREAAERRMAELRAAQQRVQEEIDRLRQLQQGLEQAIGTAEHDLAELRRQIDELLARRQGLAADIERAEQELEALRGATTGEQARLRELSEQINTASLHVANLQREIARLSAELERLEQRRRQLEEAIIRENTRLTELGQRQQQLLEEILIRTQQLGELKGQVSVIGAGPGSGPAGGSGASTANTLHNQNVVNPNITVSPVIQNVISLQQEVAIDLRLLMQYLQSAGEESTRTSQTILDLQKQLAQILDLLRQTLDQKRAAEQQEINNLNIVVTVMEEKAGVVSDTVKEGRRRATKRGAAEKLAKGEFIFSVIYGLHTTVKALESSEPTTAIPKFNGAKTRLKNAITTCDELIDIVKGDKKLKGDAKWVKTSMQARYAEFQKVKLKEGIVSDKSKVIAAFNEEIATFMTLYEFTLQILKNVYGDIEGVDARAAVAGMQRSEAVV